MANERLQKLLAQAGVASRRAAEQLIRDGKVRLNGRIVTELGIKADGRRDRIEVDGRKIVGERPAYYLLHKPREVVTTLADPEGRPTIAELLRNIPERVFPVGRLDFHTSGALLLTNDGDMTQALLHPRKLVPKTYIAKIKGELPLPALQALREGVTLDDGHRTRRSETFVVNAERGLTWLQLTITEGKNRQIHRMLEAVGFMVMRLSRPTFAGLDVEGLRHGAFRPLTQSEIAKLKRDYLNPSKKEEANRKKAARWERAEAAELAQKLDDLGEEDAAVIAAEADADADAGAGGEQPTAVPADRKPRPVADRPPARDRRDTKSRPFRTAPPQPQRNAKFPGARPGKFEPARAGKFEPARAGKFEPARAGKFEPARAGKFEPARAGKFEPARTGKFGSPRPTKFEPTRTGKFGATRPAKLEPTRTGKFPPRKEDPRPPERQRFVTAAERRRAMRSPPRPPEPDAKAEPLRAARTKRRRGSKPEPRTEMTEALRARANKLRTHLRRKRTAS